MAMTPAQALAARGNDIASRGANGKSGNYSNYTPAQFMGMNDAALPKNFNPAMGGGNANDYALINEWNDPNATLAQQRAAGTASIDALSAYHSYQTHLEDAKDPWAKVALMANVAGLTAGVGGALAPAVAGAVGGGTAGAVAGGAATGAVGGIAQGALTGGNIGKDALFGVIGGGITGGVSSIGNSYGVPGAASKLAGGVLSGLAKGALSGSGGGAPSGGGAGMNYLGAGALGAGALGAGAMMNGGQGNNGNMASTDSTLAGTIAGALPGILQAGATAGGALAGSNAQVGALNNAITTQQGNLGNINSLWSKQQQLGQGADTSLGRALGTNGQPADYSGFENMPGYKFATQQGTQAIQRQAAAMGNAYTPNTAAAVGQYVTGTAMQDYNTYINQLMGAAGLGTTANQGLQTGNQNTANNISQAQVDIGQSKAGAYNTSGTAAAGFFSPNGAGSSLIGAAGRFLGGGGGGSGGGGSGIGSPVRGPGGSNLFQGPQSNWNNTGAGNGTWGSGYDPNTGSSWVNQDATQIPSFDTGSMSAPTSGFDLGGGGASDFGGGLDYGSSDMNFLGGGWG